MRISGIHEDGNLCRNENSMSREHKGGFLPKGSQRGEAALNSAQMEGI